MGGVTVFLVGVIASAAAVGACGSNVNAPSPTPIRTTTGRVQIMTPTPTSVGSQAPRVFSGSAAIEVGDQFFLPTQIIVTVGTTVTWTNRGQVAHTATARDKSFDSATLGFNDSFKFMFTKVGRFPFYCLVHTDMFGEVVVQAP